MSLNYNRVILGGNLTRDPQTKQVRESSVTEFGLAINRKYKSNGETREETTFADITAWGRTGELVAQYLTKGSSCMVEGRLKFDSWEDQQSGQKRSKLSVVADSVQFIGSREGGQSSSGQATSRPAQAAQQPIDDEEIPF